MARGQSPYQGRYVVPQVDFSPIAQGGRDIGAALSSIGGSIGSAVVKRKELKGKLDTYSKMVKGMEADVELYLDADPEERKRVSSMIKQFNQEAQADPSKNLIQKVAAYEAGLPILKSRLDNAFRERKFEEEKRRTGLMYPPMPSLDGMPSPQAGGTGTPLVPDPSSFIPATPSPSPLVPDPSSFIPASQPSATEPDPDTLKQVAPPNLRERWNSMSEKEQAEARERMKAAWEKRVQEAKERHSRHADVRGAEDNGEIGSWEEFDEAGEELDILQREKAIPDVPEGFDSWEEYKNVQQMDLWDEAKGPPGPIGVTGVVAQPLLKVDESISVEIADKLGLDIPTKAFRAPSPLTDKEKEHLNKLRSDPAFLSHPQGGSFFRATLARLEAKKKAHDEWPITKIDHLRNLVALRGDLFEMDIDRKTYDLDLMNDEKRASYISSQNDIYQALGEEVDWTWADGKLTARIKGIEGAKDMIPVRIPITDKDGKEIIFEPVNQFRLPGSSVIHTYDPTTEMLVKSVSPKDASEIAFNSVRILKIQMDNIADANPLSDVKNPDRPTTINFHNVDRILDLMRRGESTAEGLSHESFAKALLDGSLVGDEDKKGWYIANKKLLLRTKVGTQLLNFDISIDGDFKKAVKAWVQYHKSKEAISDIVIAAQAGIPGETGDRGPRGEIGIPEFPRNQIEFPRKSYNRQEILDQIRK